MFHAINLPTKIKNCFTIKQTRVAKKIFEGFEDVFSVINEKKTSGNRRGKTVTQDFPLGGKKFISN